MYFFKPTYKTYDNETTNEIYRKEMLQVFELDEFDLEKINLKIKEIFNTIKQNKTIINHLEKYKKIYNLDDMELTLMYMFSWDHFDEFCNVLITENYNQ
tara:strand:+ start:220 stop:516 length:297 start_codon:yes stop_codon:yes gene_type:complete